MDIYGIIGNPLGHSFSWKYFSQKFENEQINAKFLNFPITSICELHQVLESHPNLKGLSVTIPYKQEIIPLLNELDPLAKDIGAVNSVRVKFIEGTPHLTGYNTDIYGFTESLKPFLGNVRPKALILGTGGASKAIAKGLDTLNIPYRFVSRNDNNGQNLTYNSLDSLIIKTHKLIINCSPLGTFPNVNESPNIPYEFLDSEHYLYDLVYNPQQTLFMKKGAQQGAHTHNGLKMLHLQAEKSWSLWNK